jgi:response regulator RpfG family c-di-GMP phosphodiesterase
MAEHLREALPGVFAGGREEITETRWGDRYYREELRRNFEKLQNIMLGVITMDSRIDGSGYPRGLKEREILLEARIVTVADVVEAMTFPRPYRPKIGLEKALSDITNGRGLLYHAPAVDACLRLFGEGRFHFGQPGGAGS